MKEYYVYILIDPRNNEVFYIGKGCGSRVLSHEIDAEKNDNSNKLKRINDIKASGNNVIKTIFSQHLSEEQAFDDEAKLINFYKMNFPNQITNIQGGHHCKYIMPSEELEDINNTDFIDNIDDKMLLICVKSYNYNDTYENNFLNSLRGDWYVGNNPNKTKKYDYIGIVINNVIKFVYKNIKWTKSNRTYKMIRHYFEGDLVSDSRYINKSIKGKIKFGLGNPLKLINCK
jgi:hypothetical protein